MALWLLPILVLSLLYVGYFSLRVGAAGRTLPGGATAGQVDKATTLAYLFLSTVLISGLLISHLAMPGPIVSRRARHFEFRGVAVTVPSVTGNMSNVRISGDLVNGDSEVQRGFRWAALPSGSLVDLRPDQLEGDKVLSYRAMAKHLPGVARLNGRCINDVVGGWLDHPTEIVIVANNDPSAQVRFSLRRDRGKIGLWTEAKRPDPVTLGASENLRSLLRRSGLAELVDRLASISDPRGFSCLDVIQIVRYDRRDNDSQLGLLNSAASATSSVNPSGPGFTVTVNSGPVSRPPSIPGINGRFALEVDGTNGRDRITLPASLNDTVDGQIRLRFGFDPPRAYPLPPDNLLKSHAGRIVLTSSSSGPNEDGYTFDTGNINETSSAIATLSEDGAALKLANPRSEKVLEVEPNKDHLLGEGSVVPIFALVDPLKGKQGTPVTPVFGIAVGFGLCCFAFINLRSRKAGSKRPPRDLSTCYPAFPVWVITTSLLAIRTVLAYRVSLLPPFNMDASAAASFRACWPRAYNACTLLPIVCGFLVFIAVRAKSANGLPSWVTRFGKSARGSLDRLSKTPWLRLSQIAYALAFVVSLSAFLQKYLHLPLPSYSLLTVLLILVALVFEGVAESRDSDFGSSERPKADEAAQAWLISRAAFLGKVGGFFEMRKWPLLVTSLLTLAFDPGSIIFFFPLALALAVASIAANFGRTKTGSKSGANLGKAALAGLALVFVLGIAFAPGLGDRFLTNSWMGKVVQSSAFPYRLAAVDAAGAEHLLVDPATRSTSFRAHDMQETLHQRWEMLTYVKASPTGYFGTPLSKAGMTYPTMVSDAVFSIFLVGEHGKLAGFVTVGLILTLVLTLFRAAWNATRIRTYRSNARALYAIASVIGGAALYMSLANLWVVPFTGQNMPLLSLESREDLLLNGLLIGSALLLIAFPGGQAPSPDRDVSADARRNGLYWWGFPASLAICWVLLGVSLTNVNGSATESFNLKPETLAAIQDRLSRAAAETAGGHIPLAQTAAVTSSPSFVKAMFDAYSRGAVSRTPFVSDRGGSRLILDRGFFMIPSPFVHEEGVPWHGSLLAQGSTQRRQLVIGGSRAPVILEPDAGVAELTLGQPVKSITAQTIEIRQRLPRQKGRGARFVDYGGVTLSGNDVVIRWRSSGKPGAILINGERPKQKLNEHVLVPSDVVSLEYTGVDGVVQKLTLSYPGPTEVALAQVAWRNGKYSRSFPQGSDFPLAYTIGEIGDANVKAGKPVKDVTLSLDLSLQRDLETLLRSWGRERERPVDSGTRSADGLPFTAVTVMNSGSGGIVALAAIPQCDPSDDLAALRNRFPSEREALIAARSSWAFVNRTIGSTIKPLSYSALSTQLNHDGFDLGTLHVNEAAAVETAMGDDAQIHRAYKKLGDIELKRGKRLGLHESPRSDVDMETYLRDSRTWPAIVTSTIGLVSDRSHPAKQKSELQELLPAGSGSLRISGHSVSFAPRKALTRLFAPDGSLSSLELDNTAYFRGIQTCYGPGVAPFNAEGNERWDDGLDKTFYGVLDTSVTDQSLRGFGLPDVHRTDTTNLTDLDSQLIRYMIGSGECRWNALTMATNAARIMTGIKVQPTFRADARAVTDVMPAPVSNFTNWRRPRILDPLMHISTIPEEYQSKIHACLPPGYRIAMKTGTIDDGATKGAKESEMLMFTVGPYSEAAGFDRLHSVSCFLSIRSSKDAEGDDMIKGDLAARVIPIIVAHLRKGALVTKP